MKRFKLRLLINRAKSGDYLVMMLTWSILVLLSLLHFHNFEFILFGGHPFTYIWWHPSIRQINPRNILVFRLYLALAPYVLGVSCDSTTKWYGIFGWWWWVGLFLVPSLGTVPTRMQTFRRHAPGARNHSEKDTQLHAGTRPKNVKLAYQWLHK